MPVIFTLMPIFNKPGPMRDLLLASGFTHERITADTTRTGRPTPAETRDALLRRAPEMEYYLANIAPLDREFFAKAVNLRHVSMFGVGLDHIDMAAATECGVIVSNTPGANARCVAEMALCFMLDLAHRMNGMRAEMRKGSWRQMLGSEITGKTLGLVGFGHIAQDLALLAKAFNMRVVAANRTPRPETAAALGVSLMTLPEVLAEADFVSLHIPGGPSSWHFGAKEFAMMRQGAFFINTARGDLVDVDALVESVKSGHLAGAGLDVFPEEPMDFGHPVFSLPQITVSPHAGGLSIESMTRVTEAALAEFGRTAAGERAVNVRNPLVYDSPKLGGKSGT